MIFVQTIQILFISELKPYSNTICIKYRSCNREFTKGMVFTTILAYFLNYMLNSVYFFFKLGI